MTRKNESHSKKGLEAMQCKRLRLDDVFRGLLELQNPIVIELEFLRKHQIVYFASLDFAVASEVHCVEQAIEAAIAAKKCM